MNLSKNKTLLFITLFIFCCVFARLIISPILGAHDLPYIYPEQFAKALSLPEAWITRYGNSFGSDNITTLWLYPFDLLGGALASIGFSYGLFIKIFGVASSVIVGFTGIWLLLRDQNVSERSKVVGGLFYTINTYFLLLIDGGQIQIALAYGLLPLAFYSFIRSINSTIASKVKLGLVLSLLGFADVRFIYIFAIISVIFSLLHTRLLIKIFQTGVVAGITYVFLNFYWLYPLLVYRVTALPSSYTEAANFGTLSFATFWHSFELLTPHWSLNVFGKISPVIPALFILPFLALLAPVFIRKNKTIALYLITAIVGTFLSKGASAPFPSINIFLFQHIPGMSLFRDPTKFYFLTALGYSILVAMSTDIVFKKKERIFTFLVSVLVCIYLSVIILPVVQGKLTGLLSAPSNIYEHNIISEKIEMQKTWGRTLWIPNRLQIGYSSINHPSIDMDIVNQIRPFISQSVGSYEINNFLREGSYTGELLSMSGISSIAYPPLDERRDSTKPEDVQYHTDFWNQISSKKWVNSVNENLFTIRDTQNQIFPLNNMLFVLGPDSFYNELSNHNAHLIGSVYLEQMPEISPKVVSTYPIIAYRKNNVDLLGSMIPLKNTISVSSYLQNDPNSSQWWKRSSGQFREVRTFLQDKYSIDMSDFDYGSGWAFSEGNNTFQLPSDVPSGHLFIRVLVSSLGGNIKIINNSAQLMIPTYTQNNDLVRISLTGLNDTPKSRTYESAVFHWMDVGLVDHGSLSLTTNGTVNVVTALAIVPQDEYLQMQKKVKDTKLIDWQEMTKSEQRKLLESYQQPTVTITKDTPTQKQFTVTNSTQPLFVGFSNSYSSLWRLDDSESFPLFTFLNAFYIPGNGTYTLRYLPQKQVNEGFIVSAVSFILLIIYLLWRKRS